MCIQAPTLLQSLHCVLRSATMSTVLGVYDDAGPVLIRTSTGTGKPTSQDTAVLGSVLIYAKSLGYGIGSVLTDDCRISFKRFSPSLMFTVITSSKFADEDALQKFLEVVYLILQAVIGPSELEAIAGVNTANDALRRALIGTGSVLDALLKRHATSPLNDMLPQVTLVPHKQCAPVVEALLRLTQAAGTEYAVITYDNIFAVATQSFWHLHPEELVVLQTVLYSIPDSSTFAQIPVHLPHTSSDASWYLMIATLTAGCRLILLTNQDMSLAQMQALVPQDFGTLKPQLQKARSSAVSSNLHSLLAFILYQEHPDCMMLSSCQDDVSQQPGSESLNADGKGRRGFLAMDDGVRHQQALNTVSVFAASMSEQMLVSSQHPADTQQPVVIEAFAEVAGLRLAAVSEQHGKSKRSLFAALTPELSSLSEKELTQQLLSLLKH